MTGTSLVPSLLIGKSVPLLRRRELPLVGELLVKVGDVVTNSTIVGRTTLQGELIVVRVGELLGVNGEEFRRLLRVGEGDAVASGALLAELRGLFGLISSSVFAPIAGIVEFISDIHGHIGIRAARQEVTLTAYLAGEVVDVEANLAVTIRAVGGIVQGAFGVGGERLGTLAVLDVPSTAELLPAHLPSNCLGLVLAGGSSPTVEFLQAAKDAGVVGIVTASIADRVLTEFLGYEIGLAITGDEDLPFSLIITEGFGRIELGPRVIDVISTANGAPVSINGATQVRAGAIRPELLIHRMQGATHHNAEPSLAGGLRIDAEVRIIRAPYFGVVGRVLGFPVDPVTLPSGVTTRVAEIGIGAVDRGAGNKVELTTSVLIPFANLELYRS